MNPNKRIDLLLRAFAEAFADRIGVALEVIGDGGERGRLQQLARELDIAEQVRFAGRLSRVEVREAMWRAHGLVSSSDHETFGVAIIEAMATGIPVVATRSGGPGDFVTRSVGYLVEPGSVAALARAMRELYENHAHWFAASQDIRAACERGFGERAVVEQLLACYQRAMAD